MATSVLTAEARSRGGRSGAQAARRAGFVPAVVYGPKIDSQKIQVSAREFDRLVRGGGSKGLVELRLGSGEPTMVLVKEVYRQPVSKEALHIDFHAVIMDQDVQVTVALEFVGEPKGVQDGGVPQFLHHAVDVTCLPLNIPAGLRIDVSDVGLNETLLLGDIPLPEGVALALDPEETLVTVTVPSVVEEEPAEGEADESAAEAGAEAADGEADGDAEESAESSGDDA